MGTSLPASEPATPRRPLSPWGLLSIGFLLPGWLCLTTCVAALLLGQLARQAPGVPIHWLIAGVLAVLWAFPLLGASALMRRVGWSRLKPFGLGLALAAAYGLAAIAMHILAGEDRILEGALRLGGLALLCLGCGLGALRSTGHRCLETLVHGGLGVPNLAGLATAAAVVGLLTVGWPLAGALGDVVTSLVLLLHTLALVLPEEMLFRGLILGRLLREQPRRWLAVALSLAIYAIVIPTMILPGANWDQLVWLLVLLPLAVLTTHLRLLTGNVWAGVVVAWVFRAMPRLFTDPRDDLMEPTQALAWVAMVGGVLAVAALLWLVGRFGRRRGASLRPAALVLSIVLAVAAWAGWTGAWVWAGVPGFHNDGFIIVMEQRADLSAARGIRDLLARRAYVYKTLVATAETTQAPVRARLEGEGLSYRAYYLQNMIAVEGYHWRRWEFAGLPGVAAVIVNPNVRAYPVHSQLLGIQPDGGAGDPVQWNLHQVGADPVWDMGYRGQGVVVAGQDTGFDWQHPALRHSYRGWDETTGQADHAYNWHDVWDGSLEPFDEDGHGTHTLGIIVGDDEAGNRVGVAPAGRWIGCRNMRRGIGNPAAYLECMQFFLAPYPTGGDPVRDGDVSRSPDVVNNSWGCPDSEGCQADTLQGAVEALRAAGIMVVASAGNDGPACETVLDPIARYASAFTVGATNRGETIAYFSSRGPVAGANGTQLVKPDVVAPGDDVRSSTSGGGYGTASGTSMAGPHVAGVVALLWSARPELIGDVEATEDILRRSATPVEVKPACERPGGRPAKRGLIVEIANAIAYAGVAPTCACGGVAGVPNNVYGWGLVNAQEAAQMAIGSGEENK